MINYTTITPKVDFPPLLFLNGSHILPVAQGFSLKPTSDFIFLFRFTSYGSKVRTDTLTLVSRNSGAVRVLPALTRVVRQVREGDGIALHLVRDAAQEDADFHLLRDVLVLVGRGLEDNGDLPVHIRLGELAVCLPGTFPEDDLDVICRAAWKRRRRWSSGGVTKNWRAGAQMTFLHFVTQHVDLRLPSTGTSVLVQASDLQL